MRTRRVLLFVVMVGALSLSFNGQVEAVRPQVGVVFAVVFALTFDIATLVALHEVTTAGVSARVRRWAWLVLVQAGATALGLNTWHGLSTATLPVLAAIAVGAGPVMLAWSLSHLIALVFAERSDSGASTTVTASPTASPPVVPDGEDQPAGRSATSAGPLEPPVVESAGTRLGNTPDAAAPAPGSVTVVADALVDRAERLERQALAASNGKQGISYRAAAKRLRVRYPTGRAALDAARSRMASDHYPPQAEDGAAA